MSIYISKYGVAKINPETKQLIHNLAINGT
jgi:hypothetical protein